jgi:hypothetical protein
MGFGMGFAMAPTTEAIMGSLPKEKAGIGSAMNDVVRELGATLGVAVLGSVLSTNYASSMDGATGLTGAAADAASDSVGGAHDVAASIGGTVGSKLIAVADQSFVDAMNSAASIAAMVALVGAFIALAFLPARARDEREYEALAPTEVPELSAA